MMFRLALGIAILGFAQLAAADFSGAWTGTMGPQGSQVQVSLSLFQRGQAVAGWVEIGDDAKEVPVEKANIRDEELTFEAHNNANRLVRFRLKLDALDLRGEANVEGQVAALFLSRPRDGGRTRAGVQTWQYPRSGVSAPVVLNSVEPEYTAEARAAGLQGTVLLRVEVDPTGRLAKTNIQVLRSLGTGLDEKAIEAVKNWKFKPGMKDGHPVTTPVTIEVNFRL